MVKMLYKPNRAAGVIIVITWRMALERSAHGAAVAGAPVLLTAESCGPS